MSALDRILSRSVSRGGVARHERSWPVGKGEVFGYETAWGHDDSRFSPDEASAERYMTSNDVYSLLASKARLIQDVPLRFYRGKGSKKKEIESSRAVDLFEWVNPHWCVDDQTEALTARGWVGGSELTTDDLILSMDPVDGQLKWSPVKSIYRDNYSGPMHHVRQGPMDALVTPGHKFPLLDGRMIEVENLRQGHVIRAMGAPLADDLLSTPYSDAFVELVGWAVTEGSYVRTRTRKGRRGEQPVYGDYRPQPTTVNIGQKDGTERCERIRQVIKEAGARWHETLSGSGRRIRIFGVTGEVAQALLHVAPQRVMSSEFLVGLTSEQRELLIDTIVSADGSRNAQGSRYFYQKDKAALDAFLMLCAMSGYPASYKLRTWDGDHFGGPVWTSTVCKRSHSTVRPRRRIPADVHYEGLVWCPSTDYGTFVCRRAGRVYVTGNTAERLARMDEMSMGLWGETFWAIEPPSRESPNGEIWWLKPSRVKVAKHETEYLGGFWYEPVAGPRIFFTDEEIVWYRYPNPSDEFSALPPLLAAKLAADTAMAMMTSNRKLFVQGMQIAGVITPAQPELEFSEPQVDDLERHLTKRFTGPERSHRWAVLRKEVKFNQMSLSPKDAEYIDGLSLTFRQVCRAYGLQPALHGDLEQASPGDTDALERIEWARTLAPDLRFKAAEVREQYLKRHFPDRGEPNHAEYDFTGVPAMQSALNAVAEREASYQDRGLITINEWREARGLPPVPWGDSPWLPMNKGQFLAEGEQPKGTLVIPGQGGGGGMPGEAGLPGEPGVGVQEGLPQSAVQGGPQLTDAQGVPLPKLPDDEVNPTTLPERVWVSHWEARNLLASFTREAHLNGHRKVGVR